MAVVNGGHFWFFWLLPRRSLSLLLLKRWLDLSQPTSDPESLGCGRDHSQGVSHTLFILYIVVVLVCIVAIVLGSVGHHGSQHTICDHENHVTSANLHFFIYKWG